MAGKPAIFFLTHYNRAAKIGLVKI